MDAAVWVLGTIGSVVLVLFLFVVVAVIVKRRRQTERVQPKPFKDPNLDRMDTLKELHRRAIRNLESTGKFPDETDDAYKRTWEAARDKWPGDSGVRALKYRSARKSAD